MKQAIKAASGVLAWLAVSAPSQAQEYCVGCSAPEATYRCVIVDARPGAAQSIQLSCLTALARDGGHAQCSIKRGVTVLDCDAPIKRVTVGPAGSLTSGPGSDATVPSVAPPGPSVLAPVPPPVPDPKAPPTTVLEAAQRASKATSAQIQENNENLKAAGAATAGFFKKSLTCIGSFFTKCGN
jgi:hypothetical protein